MICVQISGSDLVIQDPQPATISDSTCSYVLQKPSELSVSPFAISVEQGQQIGIAILLLCALAWGFRMVRETIQSSTSNKED